jgi:hypothetical protein
MNTMKKYYPASWLPANAADDVKWNANRISKSQTNTFHYMWYPTQTGLQNWIDASQDYQAWAMRFVAEAFRRDSRNVSSAVHLFIDAWPAGWMKAIMDVDRQPKKAFFAYRNALVPLMVSLRTDRYSLFAGEDAMVEAWVCNDKNEVPSGYRLGYEVVVDGKTIARDLLASDIAENAASFQGMINFKVPSVAVRTKAIIKAGLFNKEGVCMNATSQELTVYPSHKPVPVRIFSDGKQSEKAVALATEMKGTIVNTLEDAQLLILDDASAYTANRNNIDQFVRKGGKVLFTEVPAGKYDIANTTVEVKHTIMGEYYFANPDASLLKDQQFQPKDFFLWYDKKAGYIQPLLNNVFRAEGWSPLVTTGLCNFAGEDPAGYLAAATLPMGKGKFIFCELTLANRVLENPAAFALLKKIIQ